VCVTTLFLIPCTNYSTCTLCLCLQCLDTRVSQSST
jgi:hypothetical protein